MEKFEVPCSAGTASPENLPPLLQHILPETSFSFDKYESDIENPPQASPNTTLGASSEQSPMRISDPAAAIPSKHKPDLSPYPSKPTVSGSPLPSHVISISMPSSPAKFQMERAKKVAFRAQKVDEDTEMSRLQNSSSVSFNFTKITPRTPVKAYSQPIPTGNAYAESLSTGNIPNGTGDRRNFESRAKDNSYAFFKTRSEKIERQLSRLRGKPQEGDNGVRPGDCEIESLPAGRYFDALQGPELEILRESEELVIPKHKQWPFLLRFPVSFFGVCLGVGSQAVLWKTLAAAPTMKFLHVPQYINLVLWCVAVLTFIIISTVYVSKCIFYFEAVRREYYHPVRVNFFFAPWIACMFLAIGVPPHITKSVHPGVWCAFMAPLLCLELKIYGQWMSGGERRLSKVANPSNHLSIVGNFVGALLGAITGWKEGAIFFFAVGLAHYMVLFVTLYQRLPTNETLPQELHPVFFLFVAAPSVASVAWERIQGDFDCVSRIAYFIAIFLYASLAVRLNFFRGFRFSIAWWAYTFPTTGAAIATIKYSNKINNPFTRTAAVALSAVSSLTVSSLLVATLLHAFVWGTLFPNDNAIAITEKKHKKKKNRKSASDQNNTMLSKAVTT
uniref:Uncharacterized protein n=1 Tax=Araucaria cunninghamii TaxID=56994 RepID=A0A0D6QYG5_ARACU